MSEHPLVGRKQTREHVANRVASLRSNGKLKGKTPWNRGMVGHFMKDMTGGRFGRLVVLGYDGWHVSPSGSGQSVWKCLCDCGEAKAVTRSALIGGRSISCGCANKENAQKLGLSNVGPRNGMFGARGPLNPHWNSELTDEERHRVRGAEYVAWAKAIKTRDDYTCQACGVRGVELHSHHISPWNGDVGARFDVANGTALCVECHTAFHKEYGDAYEDGALEAFRAMSGLIAAA